MSSGRRPVGKRGPGAILALGLLAASLSCSAPSAAGRSAALAQGAQGGAACRVTSAEIAPLVHRGREIEIEPQAVVALERGVVLAGRPVYEWTMGAEVPTAVERDRFFGVVLGPDSIEEIPLPPNVDSVYSLRATALDGRRTGWLFHEAEPGGSGMPDRDLRVTYHELEAGRWSAGDTVLSAGFTSFDFPASSQLRARGGDLRWLVLARGDQRLLDLRRVDGRWRSPTSVAAVTPPAASLLESARLARHPTEGDVVVLAGRHPVRPYGRWLRWAAEADPPGAVTTLYRAARGDERITFPRVSDTPAGPAVGWVAATNGWEGPVLVVEGIGTRRREPRLLDSVGTWVVPVDLEAVGIVWLVQHVTESGAGELRAYVLDRGGEPRLLWAIPTPYPIPGPFEAVATSPSSILVVGPELIRHPTHSYVRSLLIRLSFSCR